MCEVYISVTQQPYNISTFYFNFNFNFFYREPASMCFLIFLYFFILNIGSVVCSYVPSHDKV